MKFKFIYAAYIFCSLYLVACNNNVPASSEDDIKWSAEKSIIEETQYTIYDLKNVYGSGIIYMGVTEWKYDNGEKRFSVYTNFVNNFTNTYSLSSITYSEEEIEAILKFLDRCGKFNPVAEEGVVKALRFVGKDYMIVYTSNKEIGVMDNNDNRFAWNKSLTEIRNLFASAKTRIEELKKNNAKSTTNANE